MPIELLLLGIERRHLLLFAGDRVGESSPSALATIRDDENAAQYVTTVTDPTATSFYGKRYIFSFIKTRTLSLDTRVNWTFNPNLTLQLFAQPFIASGAYSSFRCRLPI